MLYYSGNTDAIAPIMAYLIIGCERVVQVLWLYNFKMSWLYHGVTWLQDPNTSIISCQLSDVLLLVEVGTHWDYFIS